MIHPPKQFKALMYLVLTFGVFLIALGIIARINGMHNIFFLVGDLFFGGIFIRQAILGLREYKKQVKEHEELRKLLDEEK